jgi:hypothetical protein
MTTEFDDDKLRRFLRGTRSAPLENLDESDDVWRLGTFSISKRRAVWNDGWTHDLRPESRLYKRWFDFPDEGKSGWAIIFRIFDPTNDGAKHYETFPGWVPPERGAEVDGWIELLNGAIAQRFVPTDRP